MVQQVETSLAVQSHAGFQLWINLPAKDKMMKPRYQDYQAEDIPVAEKDGASGGPLSQLASLRPCMLASAFKVQARGVHWLLRYLWLCCIAIHSYVRSSHCCFPD